MQKLKLSATVNAVLCFLAVLSLIFLFLALSDIANGESDTSLEWYIAGVCMIILAVFAVSSVITSYQIFKHLKTLKKEN